MGATAGRALRPAGTVFAKWLPAPCFADTRPQTARDSPPQSVV
jgi:hypothetical protein